MSAVIPNRTQVNTLSSLTGNWGFAYENIKSGFLTRSTLTRLSQKWASGLKAFGIKQEGNVGKGLYYLFSENKDADQLSKYCASLFSHIYVCFLIRRIK